LRSRDVRGVDQLICDDITDRVQCGIYLETEGHGVIDEVCSSKAPFVHNLLEFIDSPFQDADFDPSKWAALSVYGGFLDAEIVWRWMRHALGTEKGSKVIKL